MGSIPILRNIYKFIFKLKNPLNVAKYCLNLKIMNLWLYKIIKLSPVGRTSYLFYHKSTLSACSDLMDQRWYIKNIYSNYNILYIIIRVTKKNILFHQKYTKCPWNIHYTYSYTIQKAYYYLITIKQTLTPILVSFMTIYLGWLNIKVAPSIYKNFIQ